MLAEFEGNILDLDLTKGSVEPNIYDPEWGINNTIRGWTKLDERMSKLIKAPLSIRNTRQLLYSSGYSLTEIAEAERPPVSREAIRQFVVSVQKPPVITILRGILPSKGQGLTMDQVVDVLRGFISGSSPKEVTNMLGIKNGDNMKRKQLALHEVGFPIEIPVKEDTFGYRRLAESDEWESLESAVRKVHGRGLPSLDLLYPVLVAAGFNAFTKPHGGNTYYFFPVAEEDRLLELKEISPEVFQSRSWQRFNPRSK